MKFICSYCYSETSWRSYLKCRYCHNELIPVFNKTKVNWRKGHIEYEGGEKEAISFFVDLRKVTDYRDHGDTHKTESLREEKLKRILDELKQASNKKYISKYLKDWAKNPELKTIFSDYLKKQPNLCLLLIDAGFVITKDALSSALETQLVNKNHDKELSEVISIILKKLDSNSDKKEKLIYVIDGENPRKLETISQNITILPNLTLVDHKSGETFLHNFLRTILYYKKYRTASCLGYIGSKIVYPGSNIIEYYIETCKTLVEFISTHVDPCTTSRIATTKGAQNETTITLGRQAVKMLNEAEENGLREPILELVELLEKSVKQRRKVVNRRTKRREMKTINLEETMEDLEDLSF